MELTPEQEALRDGAEGPGRQRAIKTQLDYGEARSPALQIIGFCSGAWLLEDGCC